MKLYRSLLNIFLVIFSLRGQEWLDLYTPFQRDVMFFIDWESLGESPAAVFQNIGQPDSAILTSEFAAALYNPSVPIIFSSSLLNTLTQFADIFRSAFLKSQDDFIKGLIAKYQDDPYYSKTLLTNTSFLTDLYVLCRKSHEIYQEINTTIATKLAQKRSVSLIATDIVDNSKFRDPTLQGVLREPHREQVWRRIQRLLLISYIIIEEFSKKSDDWILRKVNECVHLMIPKSYLEGIRKQVGAFNNSVGEKPVQNILANSLKDAQTGRSLTVDEILLGIKFESFSQDAALPQRMTCRDGIQQSNNFIHKSGNTFGGILPHIFINPRDFSTFTPDQFLKRSALSWVPYYAAWNIFAIGHGSPDGSFVFGLERKAFLAFLDFFNALNTRFLYYVSCYAGGEALRATYVEHQKKELKPYDYTIAIGALQAAPAYGVNVEVVMPPFVFETPYYFTSKDIDIDRRAIKVKFYLNYGQFFNDLHTFTKIDPKTGKKQPVTYKDVLSLIQEFADPAYYANIPQIKMSGAPWFSVIDLDQEMLRLTRTFVRTKEAEIKAAQRPEDKQLIVHNKKLLLIDAETPWGDFAGSAYSEVPFPITVEGSMPIVVSMVLGNGYHGFDKLDARQFGLTELVQKFWGIPSTEYARMYFIKELQVRNDLDRATPSNQATYIGAQGEPILTLKNVCIFANSLDPRPGGTMLNMQGVIFQSHNNNWYNSIYSLKDPAQVATADAVLRQRELPYLGHMPYPHLDSYQAMLKNLFSVKDAPPSLEEIAQFVAQRKHQLDLVNQYEIQKKAGSAALEAWKRTLSEKDRKFIENYEAMEKARSVQPPTSK